MKLVILGKGGKGVIFFSRMIGQTAINKGLSIRSTEIKVMAKKGGVVEIHMKIGEGMNGLVRVGNADMVILLSEDLVDYAKVFGENIFTFSQSEIDKAFNSVLMRYVNTFLLGVFIKKQNFLNAKI